MRRQHKRRVVEMATVTFRTLYSGYSTNAVNYGRIYRDDQEETNIVNLILYSTDSGKTWNTPPAQTIELEVGTMLMAKSSLENNEYYNYADTDFNTKDGTFYGIVGKDYGVATLTIERDIRANLRYGIALKGDTNLYSPRYIYYVTKNGNPSGVNKEDFGATRTGTYYSTNTRYHSFSSDIQYIGNSTFYGYNNYVCIWLPDLSANLNSYIGNSAMQNCTGLQTVVIGGISEIRYNVWTGCNDLKRLVFLQETPPRLLNANVISTAQLTSNCKIYVPYEALETYRSAQYWSTQADRILPITRDIVAAVDAYWGTMN